MVNTCTSGFTHTVECIRFNVMVVAITSVDEKGLMHTTCPPCALAGTTTRIQREALCRPNRQHDTTHRTVPSRASNGERAKLANKAARYSQRCEKGIITSHDDERDASRRRYAAKLGRGRVEEEIETTMLRLASHIEVKTCPSIIRPPPPTRTATSSEFLQVREEMP